MTMTPEQVDQLKKENVIKVDRIERLPIDPPIAGQNYGAFSFKLFPKPVNDVYGFLKFRGAFNTIDDFDNHAKMIIQTVDSKHKIIPFHQGHWLPITTNPKFFAEEMEVSDKDKLSDIYREKDNTETKKEKQKVKEIEERRKALVEESKREKADTDSLRYYAEKVMQLENINDWLSNLRKRKRDLINGLSNAKNEIARLDETHPDYQEQVQDEIKRIKEEIGLE